MCCKANYLLHVFSCCDPFCVKTCLFSIYLYGAALWRSSSPQLRSLEVSFNDTLRKIWCLPRHSHAGIVRSVASLQSIYNAVLSRSRSLVASAKKSPSALIRDVFSVSSNCVYTSIGYNNLYGRKYLKSYTICFHL